MFDGLMELMAPTGAFVLIGCLLVGLMSLSARRSLNAARARRGAAAEAAAVEPFPYRMRDDFLSPAEHSFYQLLKRAAGDKVTVCPKVNLRDLFLAAAGSGSGGLSAANRISQKHVDFLLCQSSDMKPVAAVELDDKSHSRIDRAQRDLFVDGVFHAAGLPLIHVEAERSYSTRELRQRLRLAVNGMAGVAEEPSPTGTANGAASSRTVAPFCPKCGSRMVLRTAGSGPKRGQQFWGCPSYPQCAAVFRT